MNPGYTQAVRTEPHDMELTGEFHVPLPREAVFEALNDPEVLGQCIPGCQALEQVSETEFDADVLAKVGPVKARFRTRIEVSNLNPPESYTLSGEGRGGAAGFASGSADVSLEATDDGTVLRYAARVQPGGKIAQVGSRLVGGTARKIGADFFSRFVEVVTTDPSSGEDGSDEQEE